MRPATFRRGPRWLYIYVLLIQTIPFLQQSSQIIRVTSSAENSYYEDYLDAITRSYTSACGTVSIVPRS